MLRVEIFVSNKYDVIPQANHNSFSNAGKRPNVRVDK
jgi:hypothetical protein